MRAIDLSLIGLLVAILAPSKISTSNTKQLDKEKLVKYFDLINKRLTENMPEIDTIDDLFKELNCLYLDEESSIFRKNKSKVAALRVLVDLKRDADNSDCAYGTSQFVSADFGLDNPELEPNHELRYTDLMVRDCAVKVVKRCFIGSMDRVKNFGNYKMIFGKKYYDIIDDHLLGMRLESKQLTPDNMMRTLKKWLTTFETKGALTEAIEQILGLRKLDKQDHVKCNQREYDVLLINELASSQSDQQWADDRQINRLIQYYRQAHAAICKPKNFEALEAKLRSLKAQEVSVLSILPAGLFQLSKLRLMLKHPVKSYETLEYNLNRAANIESMEMVISGRVKLETRLVPDVIIKRMLETLARDDPDFQLLEMIEDEKFGESMRKDEKIFWMMYRYLRGPCIEINNSLGPILQSLDRDARDLGKTRDSMFNTSEWVMFNFVKMSAKICNESLGLDKLINRRRSS